MIRKRIFLALLVLGACSDNKPKPSVALPSPPKPPLSSEVPPIPPTIGTASIGVCWDYNEDKTLHYIVYANEKPGLIRPALYTKTTTTNYAIFDGLFYGKAYFFFATAANDDGLESEPTDEIGFKIPTMSIRVDANNVYVTTTRPVPGAPNVVYRLMGSKSLNEWNEVLAVEHRLSLIDGVETIEYTVPTTERYLFFKIYIEVEKEGCAA